MYREFETKTSYKYLKKVINKLKEPICILGGWAIFFSVNDRFQKAQGRPYLGSRDIDLGFHMDGKLNKSVLAETINILKDKLKFKPLSFRLFKEIHTETEEEIQEGQIIPAHFVFPMYIDLIVDNIPNDFKKVFGFNPIDEPLLEFVFDDKNNRKIVKEFNKKLLLPKPELLLAMKLNSLPHRDKEHKRIKDICDIFVILWYSSLEQENIKEKVSKFITQTDIKKSIRIIKKTDLEKVSPQINHSVEEIAKVLNLLK
ncbi:MAG: hypothetical protein ABIF40_05275 [archaeon]